MPRNVEILIHVAENKSMKSAAAKFGISRSTVSREIMKLEEKSGVAFVCIKDNILEITTAGRHFLNSIASQTTSMELPRGFFLQGEKC